MSAQLPNFYVQDRQYLKSNTAAQVWDFVNHRDTRDQSLSKLGIVQLHLALVPHYSSS
jgi:hypothetical protein